MRVDKIYFEELFPTGQFANQRLSMDIIMEPQDYEFGEVKAVHQAYAYAKELTHSSFKALNPHLSAPTSTDNTPSAIAPAIDRGKETLKEIINDCTTVEELIKQKNNIMKYGLVDMYADKLEFLEAKLKELS